MKLPEASALGGIKLQAGLASSSGYYRSEVINNRPAAPDQRIAAIAAVTISLARQ
jgi:hypothetical protein